MATSSSLKSLNVRVRRRRNPPRHLSRPAALTTTQDGARYHYDYDILSIQRDDGREDYDTDTEGNAYRIIIGDEDVLARSTVTTPMSSAIASRTKSDISRITTNSIGTSPAITGISRSLKRARRSSLLAQAVTIREVTRIYTGGEWPVAGTRFHRSLKQASAKSSTPRAHSAPCVRASPFQSAFDKGVIEPPSRR
jgi:hypothetical protein